MAVKLYSLLEARFAGVTMAPVDGSTRKINDVSQKFEGTVPGRVPSSPATLHANNQTPASNPAAMVGGLDARTALGTSFVLPAPIQSANTCTSFEAGGLIWKSVQASGVPGGIVGQDTPATTTEEKAAFPCARELRTAHRGLSDGVVVVPSKA